MIVTVFDKDCSIEFGPIPHHQMSISGHKLYGPKGVGALYVRRRPRVRVEPIQSGGGQERGIRSGTVPTPLAVGLGEQILHLFIHLSLHK